METIKGTLFIVILMTALNAYGQHRSSPKTQKGDLQLGTFYSYDQNLSSDNIEFDQYSGYHTNYNQHNFTAGLSIQYFILQNFALRSGVSYSKRPFDETFYCYNCDIVGTIQPQKFSLQFLQLPVALRLYPYNNKIAIFTDLGLLNQLMLDKLNTDALEGNTYSLSGTLGAGAAYNFGRGFSVQLFAKYTNSFSNFFKEADYSYRTLGVQLGLTKKL